LTVNDLKINIISTVSNINDFKALEWINDKVQKFKDPVEKVKTLSFEEGVTEIRSDVTADEIFAEQGNKSITYEEIKNITKDIEWEVSLDEMLEALK